MVGEVKGIEMMGVLIAGRGARERGDRRLEVKVDSTAPLRVVVRRFHHTRDDPQPAAVPGGCEVQSTLARQTTRVGAAMLFSPLDNKYSDEDFSLPRRPRVVFSVEPVIEGSPFSSTTTSRLFCRTRDRGKFESDAALSPCL